MATVTQAWGEGHGEVRVSLAAAMTLGLEKGMFYRDARLGCINILQAHPDGCIARCAYCGLGRERAGAYQSKKFIRVKWPTLPLGTVLDAMVEKRSSFERICFSMITRSGAARDLVSSIRRTRRRLDTPISALVSPTVTSPADLESMRQAGTDRIGIAVDAATPGIFEAMRGAAVAGPHRWDAYWKLFDEGVRIYGRGMVGCHLIVGLGETERDMARSFQHVRDAGGCTHLFSFFPEAGSPLQRRALPPIGQYRRMQLARWLVDGGIVSEPSFGYDDWGRLVSFGIERSHLDAVLESGKPFQTSGCPGNDGAVACNRPFANSRPGPDLRNYPFPLDDGDLEKVRRELWI